ncbi:hypothetical protein ACFZAR_42945 [Streptomyces sp. NPDC008222]|uniref:hypothetical protein n=1 Tax=Streptomyces sp. NPDC008222 TaxID=3364820 RepID=UPI0036E484A2
MRVRVLKKFTAYWNYAIAEFREGEELVGDQARHFLDNTPEGTVKVLEADSEPAPEPPKEPEAPASADGEPPVEGTIDDLMSWVDGDPERAAQALQAEQAKDKPRSTVVKRLASLVGDEE